MRVVKACIHAGCCFPVWERCGWEAATATSMATIPQCQNNTTMNYLSDKVHAIANIPHPTIGVLPVCSLTGCPHGNCHLQVGGVESFHLHLSAAPHMQVQHPHLPRPHATACMDTLDGGVLLSFGLFLYFSLSYCLLFPSGGQCSSCSQCSSCRNTKGNDCL